LKKMRDILRLVRPSQWTKNLVVFAAPVFANRIFELPVLIRSLMAFVTFCLASSVVYILNDWRDREADRLHPAKKNRPLASGVVSPSQAFAIAVLLMAVVVLLVALLRRRFFILVLAYFVMNLGYSFYFKKMVILDILLISIGFILRAISGGIAIDVEISSWLLLCTFFLSLFLILSKRRNEIVSLGDQAVPHRKILADYSVNLLDQMIAIVTGLTIIAYSLYTLSPTTVQHFGTENLVYTVPFVVYGLFKYLHIVYKKDLGGKPEEILLRDRYIQFSILGWIVCVIIIIY
jgi:4-hydroxybenzoate polyprenyltransferase